MADEEIQKELFDLEKPKRTFPKLGKIFPEGNIGVTGVFLQRERLVIVAIVIIMAIVLCYALGVEQGKVLGRQEVVGKPAIELDRVKEKSPVIVRVPATEKTPVKNAAPEVVRKSQPAAPAITEGRYTIVAATFLNRNTAQAEADKRRREGFDAFVIQSDSYFQVCVGNFNTKEAGKTVFNKVKQRYKDAYFKLK